MSTRQENEAIGGLLRRNLSRQAGANCLDADQLAAYFEHSLGAGESERCEAHLSSCARCREQLAAMIRADESPEAHAAEPQRSHAWVLDWRWLTAAAAVLAIVAVWAVGWTERIGKAPAQNAPLVAIEQRPESNLPHPPPAPPPNRGKPAPAIKANRIEQGKPLPPAERSRAQGAPESAESFAPAPSEEPRSRGAAAEEDKLANLPEPSGTASGIGGGAGAAGGAIVRPSPRMTQGARASQAASQATLGLAAPSQSATDEQGQAKKQAAPTVGTLSLAQPKAVSAGRAGASPAAEENAAQPSANASAVAGPTAQPTGARADSNAHLARSQPGSASESVTVNSAPELKLDRAPLRQTIEQRTSQKVIDTPNPSVKWRITKPGFIERTENGGATWFGEQIDPDASLLAGSAPDAKTCWMVGRNGAVYVTKNGQGWKKLNAPSDADLVAVSAKNASSAIVTTADGERFSTRNSGKKWKQLLSSADSNQP